MIFCNIQKFSNSLYKLGGSTKEIRRQKAATDYLLCGLCGSFPARITLDRYIAVQDRQVSDFDD